MHYYYIMGILQCDLLKNTGQPFQFVWRFNQLNSMYPDEIHNKCCWITIKTTKTSSLKKLISYVFKDRNSIII